MALFDIKTFDGGMNNVREPSVIAKNESQLVENAEVSNGNLVSINGLIEPSPILWANPSDAGTNKLPNRSLVSFLANDYWSINDATVAPFYGGDPVDRLGVPFPTALPILALNGVGNLTGDYNYAVTFVSTDGYESAPGDTGVYFSTITAASNKVDITVDTFPTGVDKCRIYRTEASGADFYLVAEFTTSGGTYTDNLPDDLLLISLPLTTVNDLPPPDGGKYLTEANNTFFLAVGTRLYYSKQGNPNAWNPLDWVDMGDVITGMEVEFTGIIVFTSNTASRVTGYDVLTISKELIPSNQGCNDWRTIARLDDVPIWVSNDGVCIWNGSDIQLVTHLKYEIDFTPVQGITYDDAYYLFHADGAMKFDKRSGGLFTNLGSFVGSAFNIFAWVDGDADALYLWDGVDKVFQFGVGDPQELTYVSPYINGGTTEKMYRRVWLRNDSDVDFTFNLEGDALFNTTITAGEKFFYLPAGMSGRYADIEMKTTGVIFDLIMEFEEALL